MCHKLRQRRERFNDEFCLFALPPGADRLQHANVLLVSRIIDLALDLDQRIDVDPTRGRLAVRGFFAACPGVGEGDVSGRQQEVDAIGRKSQLEDFFRVVR
jgi:hypothetical protein